MNTLFEPVKLGTLTLRNRFVRSATWEAMATPAGEVTPKLVDTIGALARGGVGLIISSHAYVSPEGQAGPGQIGVHTDAMLPGLKRMAAAAHEHGAKMVLQLAHAGYLAVESLTGRKPLAVSTAVRLDEAERKELDEAGIRRIVQAYADAAARAMEAGYDGVQIHAAHGYLFSQFLSPLFNRRTDDYGGSTANRARVIVESAEGRAAGGRGHHPDPGQGQRAGLRGGGAGGGRRGRGGGPDGGCGAGRDRDQQRHVQVREIRLGAFGHHQR